MGIDKFFKDSIILTVSNLVTGVIGFLFSIILSRQLGAEGLGLYGLVFPVYILLLCLTSEGLITATSKISAVYSSRKDHRNLNRTLSTIFIIILLWSAAVALITLAASSGIAEYIVKDTRVAGALKVICPALVFVPLSGIIKGYLYGLGTFKTAAYVDIVEKCMRVVILLGVTALLALKEVRSMVTAAYFALACGEFISLVILYIVFSVYRRKKMVQSAARQKSRIQLLFDVFVISFPLCINGFLSSVISTASTLLLPRRLMHAGFTYNVSLSLIGKFSGMALNIVYLPFIIIGSMLTVLIPDLSLKLSKKDFWAVETRVAQVLKVSALVGLATLAVCLTIPDVLGRLFYGRTDLTLMIRFAAVAGFTSYVASPTFGILNALGKQNILLRNSILISLESLVLIFILTGVPSLNIYGYGICIIVTSITAFAINMHEIRKICEVRFKVSEIVTYGMMGLLTYLLINLAAKLSAAFYPVVRSVLVVFLAFFSMYLLARLTSSLNRQV